MNIIYGNRYKNSEKNIKRKQSEKDKLDLIKNHIKNCKDYNELKNNPMSYLFSFEALKHDLSGYYSFNLCKNRGKIRLLVSINENTNSVCLEYISINHYDDFKNKL